MNKDINNQKNILKICETILTKLIFVNNRNIIKISQDIVEIFRDKPYTVNISEGNTVMLDSTYNFFYSVIDKRIIITGELAISRYEIYINNLTLNNCFELLDFIKLVLIENANKLAKVDFLLEAEGNLFRSNIDNAISLINKLLLRGKNDGFIVSSSFEQCKIPIMFYVGTPINNISIGVYGLTLVRDLKNCNIQVIYKSLITGKIIYKMTVNNFKSISDIKDNPQVAKISKDLSILDMKKVSYTDILFINLGYTENTLLNKQITSVNSVNDIDTVPKFIPIDLNKMEAIRDDACEDETVLKVDPLYIEKVSRKSLNVHMEESNIVLNEVSEYSSETLKRNGNPEIEAYIKEKLASLKLEGKENSHIEVTLTEK